MCRLAARGTEQGLAGRAVENLVVCRFRLHNSHAGAVEPLLAAVAGDHENAGLVRLLARAEKLPISGGGGGDSSRHCISFRRHGGSTVPGTSYIRDQLLPGPATPGTSYNLPRPGTPGTNYPGTMNRHPPPRKRRLPAQARAGRPGLGSGKKAGDSPSDASGMVLPARGAHHAAQAMRRRAVRWRGHGFGDGAMGRVRTLGDRLGEEADVHAGPLRKACTLQLVGNQKR